MSKNGATNPSLINPRSGWNSKGQVLLEYILLLVVTLAIAAMILRILVRKDPDEPGALLTRWNAIIKAIGEDDPNKTANPAPRR